MPANPEMSIPTTARSGEATARVTVGRRDYREAIRSALARKQAQTGTPVTNRVKGRTQAAKETRARARKSRR